MIRVSASAFDVLWADLGLGLPPEPLAVHSVGHTDEERARVREAVYANLAERGLYEDDRVDAELAARLELLAAADVLVSCEALGDMTAEEPFRAVAGARGRHGVLATQPERTIGVAGIGSGELFSAIVDTLPELRPGPGHGVSLPASTLEGDIEDPVYGGRGARSAASAAQLREVLAIQARPVYGAGQFSVHVRGADGHRHRAGGLTWFDTDLGAYCATTTPGRGGHPWITVTPTDGPRLAARLADLAT